jgi:hypothetical protein
MAGVILFLCCHLKLCFRFVEQNRTQTELFKALING